MYKIGQMVKCQECDLDEIGEDVMTAGIYKIIGIIPEEAFTVEEEGKPTEILHTSLMYIVQGYDGEQYNIQPSVIEGLIK